MIAVSVRKDGITVDGHAGYAEPGKDIICAAVSILVHGLVCSLEALTNDQISGEMIDGHVDIVYENLSESGQLLVDSFFLAISEIANIYGSEYVQIM